MPNRLRTLLPLALAAGLAACAVTPVQESGRRVSADGTACPDTRRPLPFPIQRPDCWSDAEWDEYLVYEARRAQTGDRYNETF